MRAFCFVFLILILLPSVVQAAKNHCEEKFSTLATTSSEDFFPTKRPELTPDLLQQLPLNQDFAEESLLRMHVAVVPRHDIPTHADYRSGLVGKSPPSLGTMLEIRLLPVVKEPASPEAHALLHPDLTRLLAKLNGEGSSLFIDPTMKPLNIGARQFLFKKQPHIAIDTQTTWAELQHEVQHVHFQLHIEKYWNRLVDFKNKKIDFQSLPKSAILEIGKETLARIASLLDHQLDKKAVDETLAFQAELQSYGLNKNKYSSQILNAQQYILRHQITSLQKISPQELSKKAKAYLEESKQLHEIVKNLLEDQILFPEKASIFLEKYLLYTGNPDILLRTEKERKEIRTLKFKEALEKY